jgi:hypothetical protein
MRAKKASYNRPSHRPLFVFARLAQFWQPALLFVLVGIMGTVLTLSIFAETTNVTIDFNTTTQKLAYKPVSGSISTYGSPNTITQSASHRTKLTNLKLGMYRVPIRWNNGNPMSSAGGHPSGSGLDWVQNISTIGAEPMIVLGGEHDNDFSPQDAANLVRYFNIQRNTKVTYWVIGNEPNNGNQLSLDAYCTFFNNTAVAMKAVDPSIKLVGPAWSYYDTNVIRNFTNCAKNNVDVIDWHEYPNSDTGISNEQVMNATYDQGNRIREARNIINQVAPDRSSKIEIQIGELNWSWSGSDDRANQTIETVWAAASFGGIINAGGRAHEYADIGALKGDLTSGSTISNTIPADSPSPMYYALLMFTGGNLFRGFGDSAVKVTSSLPKVDIFASNNQKNIVAVNKDPAATRLASIEMIGVADNTTIDVWQTNKDNAWTAPTRKTMLTVKNGKIEYNLSPYSVTTFTISASAPPSTNTTEDINQDGVVNLTDLSILLSKYGQVGANIGRADTNADDKVDVHDLSLLLSKFNK